MNELIYYGYYKILINGSNWIELQPQLGMEWRNTKCFIRKFVSCLLKDLANSLDACYSQDFSLHFIFDYANIKAFNGPILQHFIIFFKRGNIFLIVDVVQWHINSRNISLSA